MTAPPGRVGLVTGVAVAMLFFAGNSLLCRLALVHAEIDPASFTLVRIASGAAMLGLIITARNRVKLAGSWRSAAALFVYAVGFSLAYTALPAGIGAFLLFTAVQATMVVAGIVGGNRPSGWQAIGMAVALAGLALLLAPAPGLVVIPALPVLLMVAAGIAWGAYSLLGRRATSPVAATAGNFVRAVPLCLAVLLALALTGLRLHASPAGIAYAVLSGAGASGLGYTIWYTVLPSLAPTAAAAVQLSVPVITALIGAAALGETLSWRLALASAAILGGIALVVTKPRSAGA